jgi:hypothetical protein
MTILLLTADLSYAFWIAAIVEYMCSESQSNKYRLLAHALNVIILTFESMSNLSSYDAFLFWKMDVGIKLASAGLGIINGFIVLLIVKRILYARTSWFLYL